MVRPGLLLGFLLLGSLTFGQGDLGRTDGLWRGYLSETVRRGLPLLNVHEDAGLVPYWPALERSLVEASSLEPGPDVELISGWMDLQAGQPTMAVKTLQQGWPRPPLTRFSSRLWGEALFSAWDAWPDSATWTNAWLAWEEKAYSPLSLVRGIDVLEKADPSAVAPLLDQALRLYPEDRRFLPLVARHPDSVNSAEGLITRDLTLHGGWSSRTIRALLSRNPAVKGLLTRAGYSVPRLDSAQAWDYGVWLSAPGAVVPADGTWHWDADQDGEAESSLVIQGGQLATWTRKTPDGGIWTLGFFAGKPINLVETRDGATWTLRYQAYPWAETLEYRWADKTMVYRFRPLAQSVPLWPAERFTSPVERLPAALASLWLPLDPRALALAAATVESWEGAIRTGTVFLFKGEVWLSVEDTNRDGRDDTWSFFRSGQLASVYRDIEGRGQAGLRELYRKGEVAQVQTRATPGPRAEFVLFPSEGIQLWDLGGTGRPLDRIFLWSGQDRLDALVFSGKTLPWETMPFWEPRP